MPDIVKLGPKELVIDRSRWLRGEGENMSALLRSSDGKMCCLGMYLLACGLSEDEIAGRSTAASVAAAEGWDRIPTWLRRSVLGGNSFEATELMTTNDDPRLEGDRERRIAGLFLAHADCTVTFVDGEKGSR